MDLQIDLRDVYKNGEIFKNVSFSEEVLTRYFTHVANKYVKNQDRNYSHWHPSALGTCGRKNIFDYYSYKNYAIDKRNYIAFRSIEIFENGHLVHHKLQKKLGEIRNPQILYGYWKCQACKHTTGLNSPPFGITNPRECEKCKCNNVIYEEVSMKNDEYNVAGNCDAIVKLSDKHEFQVIDFKTAGNYTWKETVEGKNAPVNYHIVQVNAYMWLLGINSGYIIYENRDKLCHKEFFIKRDEYIVDRIKHQLKYQNYHIQNGTVPPPNDPAFISMSEVGPDKGQCKGYGYGPGKLAPCPYYHLCWPQSFESEGGATIYNTFIKVG